MSQQLVIKTKEFDLANVNYSEPKANNSGGKNIFINYKNPKTGRFQPLILQSPKLKICYGVKPIRQRLPSDKPGTPGSGPIIKYEVSFSFGKLDDQHPKNSAFYEVFNGLDEKIVNDSVEHSVEWMGKPRNRASIDLMQELYTGSIRWSIDRETKERNTKWPPTCKAKIPYWDGKFDTKNFQIFDADSQPVDISDWSSMDDGLWKGSYARVLLQCAGIWISGKGFGVSWKIRQLVIYQNQIELGVQNAFVEDSDDELSDEEDERSSTGEETTTVKAPVVYDSDEDEDEDENADDEDEDGDETDEPEPPRIIKKRTTKPKTIRGRPKKND